MNSGLSTTITISVNGAPREVDAGTTIDQLLNVLAVRRELVAVEVNQRLVRRAEHTSRHLSEGDHVEIVEFVGGG
jgi:thiamine biosynthesis protein ThiS